MAIIRFRWHRFTWDRYAATSFAWGIGPSYATEIPPIEIETSGSSSRWLIYWYGETSQELPLKIISRMKRRYV